MISKTFAEILLLVPAALTTGFVLFLPTVIQKIMNDMSESEFKEFLTKLTKYSLKSFYAVSVSTITFIGMIPYWLYFGFDNWWFTSGLIMWVVASVVSKYMTLPIYSRVTGSDIPGIKKKTEIKADEKTKLNEEREKLQTANVVRATLYSVSLILMIIGLI